MSHLTRAVCLHECLVRTVQMLAKFAEDDRIEQMNAQKRRMKQLEHKRAVQALIEERREQFARERVGGAMCTVTTSQQKNSFPHCCYSIIYRHNIMSLV